MGDIIAITCNFINERQNFTMLAGVMIKEMFLLFFHNFKITYEANQ